MGHVQLGGMLMLFDLCAECVQPHSTLFPYKLVSMLGNVCCIVSNRIWISCSSESHTIMRNSFLIKAGGS